MLDTERKTFVERHSELLSEHPGKFVVIKGDKLIGAFDTIDNALVEGARRFGLQPFLVRQVTQTISDTVDIPALIDTGAAVTCVDESLAQRLRLPAIDVAQMMSASHTETQQNVYPIEIEIVGAPIRINVPRAIGAALAPQGITALIGRDFLQHCTLFYNGVTGAITLAI